MRGWGSGFPNVALPLSLFPVTGVLQEHYGSRSDAARLQWQPARLQSPLAEPDFARWRSAEGAVTVTFHRRTGGYLVRFIDRADFLISAGADEVTCRTVPGTSARVARDLYLNQVLPMMRSHRGELIIHASAVAIDGKTAAFVAATGRGKSTLAATFARAGRPFLSDDGLCVTQAASGYLANPNRPSFRLWQDSEAIVLGNTLPDVYADEKSRIEASELLSFQEVPLLLGAMYFLGTGESAAVRMSVISPSAALAQLLNHSFFLDAEDQERMKRHFAALTRLAETVPSFMLDYPRDFALLPSVIAAVSRHMKEVIFEDVR